MQSTGSIVSSLFSFRLVSMSRDIDLEGGFFTSFPFFVWGATVGFDFQPIYKCTGQALYLEEDTCHLTSLRKSGIASTGQNGL